MLSLTERCAGAEACRDQGTTDPSEDDVERQDHDPGAPGGAAVRPGRATVTYYDMPCYNIYVIKQCFSVCVCVRVGVDAGARAGACACVRACVCACVHVCLFVCGPTFQSVL